MFRLFWLLVLMVVPYSYGTPHQRRSLISTSIVTQFPNPTWIENIGIRSNGNLLLTLLTTPQLYTVDPASSTAPQLLFTFPNATSLAGITETTPDVFVLVAGNFSFSTLSGVAGTMSIWKADFNYGFSPIISKVATLSQAILLNGMAALPEFPETVFIADSSLGLVWKLDTTTGTYEVAIQVPEMSPSASAKIHIGINGLHVWKGYLYWSNSDLLTLFRLAIHDDGTTVPGAMVETVYDSGTFQDDFILDDWGNSWITTETNNSVLAIGSDGQAKAVVGAFNQETVAGASACRFGRGVTDGDILYVITSGGLAAPVNGTVVEGGKVVAVHTKTIGHEFVD